ncbi:MAG TPA: DUF4382 domain-containing protein [Candidatus Acidoferrum sp.]|nr:DUF4382 domain-containing protein [Candidatus Acidoferrum sp.]
MNSRKYLFIAVIVAAVSLCSCSGVKNRCVTNCVINGNANLSISISDTPPANTTILSFTLPIIGIKLTNSAGTDVAVFSPGSAANFELTRLQSDSGVVVTNASVPADTYTSLTIALGSPSGVFVNNSGAAVGNCPGANPFSVCGISGTFTNITVPLGNLRLNADANQWLDLDFNYNNAIDTSTGISINLGLSNVLAVNTSTPVGVPSGDFANVDDFTGRVTALSNSSITLGSTARGNLTATISSSIPVFDPQGLCGATVNLSCIGVGSIVSLQGVLTTAGTIVGSSLDVIDSSKTPADEVEGTIYPSNCNGGANFGMILSDSSITTGGSPLAGPGFGAGICLTVSPTASFLVDFGILTGQPGLPATGFTNANDLLAGQTVRAKITGAATGTNSLIDATATAMILRFSRLTGTVSTGSTTGFSISGLPTYITAFTTLAQVQTYQNATLFEGVSTSGLQGTVSISALFFNPSTSPITGPLQAAKVRQH